MKPLIDLTLEEYTREQNSGMFWEHYPKASGIYTKDCPQEGLTLIPLHDTIQVNEESKTT